MAHKVNYIVRLREKAVRHLCGGYAYCVGLSRIDGPDCPSPVNSLTVEDIQIGHLLRDDLKSTSLYKKVLKMKKPETKYLPLCAVCNSRMVHVKDELRKYSRKFRMKVSKHASKFGDIAASRKFSVDRKTSLTWRAEFDLSPPR